MTNNNLALKTAKMGIKDAANGKSKSGCHLNRDEAAAVLAELDRLRNGYRQLYDMIDYECQCTEPPEWDNEDEEAHSQYCPVYLLHFIGNFLPDEESV